jgi:hypothetical protein
MQASTTSERQSRKFCSRCGAPAVVLDDGEGLGWCSACTTRIADKYIDRYLAVGCEVHDPDNLVIIRGKLVCLDCFPDMGGGEEAVR